MKKRENYNKFKKKKKKLMNSLINLKINGGKRKINLINLSMNKSP